MQKKTDKSNLDLVAPITAPKVKKSRATRAHQIANPPAAMTAEQTRIDRLMNGRPLTDDELAQRAEQRAIRGGQ